MPERGDGDPEQSGDTRLPPTGKRNQRLPKSLRITRSGTFQETYEQGRKYHGKYMVMWIRRGDDAAMRLGVVTSKRVGPAVKRTRARRRLREAFRRNRDQFRGDVDVVLIARAAIVEAPWQSLEAEIVELARRAGLTGHKDSEGSIV